MRRYGTISLTMLTAVLLQTLFIRPLSLFGVSPDLVLIVVIGLALIEGPTVGATTGFAGGLLKDLLLTSPKGLTGLAYLLVGYVVGSVRPYVQSTSVFVPVAAVFIGTAMGTGLYEVLRTLLGRQAAPLVRTLQVIGLTALYNTLITPFVYPIVRRIAALNQKKQAFKW